MGDGDREWSVIAGMTKTVRLGFGHSNMDEHYEPELRPCACSLFLEMAKTVGGLFGAMNSPTLYRVFRELAENQYSQILFSSSMRDTAYCAVWNNGEDVLVWGDQTLGGDMEDFRFVGLTAPVVCVEKNNIGFLAMDAKGSVASWGHVTRKSRKVVEGDPTTEAVDVFSSPWANIALMRSGHLQTWGDGIATDRGSCMLPHQKTLKFKTVVPGQFSVVAITEAGQLQAWGSMSYWRYSLPPDEAWGGRVVKVVSDRDAFMGMSEHGRVLTWGAEQHLDMGGLCKDGSRAKTALQSGARDIAAVLRGFSAIDSAGRVHTTMNNTVLHNVCTGPLVAWVDCFATSTEEGPIVSWGDPHSCCCKGAEERLKAHLAHSAVCACACAPT